MARIKVMSAGAVQSMVTALGNEFAKAHGHELDLNFATVGTLRERLAGGEKTDLAILSESAIAGLAKNSLFVPGSIKNLGRTRTGVVIREGAPKPDISSVEAFKRALVNARVVSYSDPKGGGSSGTFFAGLLERLGIAEQVNKNAVLKKRGFEVAQAVVNGEAEIGTTFISEILTIKGAVVAGPLPGELDNPNVYTAAIHKDAAERDAGAALLAALSNPAGRARWTAAGLDPAF
jgi:molybdate transport system substrate-binding protein